MGYGLYGYHDAIITPEHEPFDVHEVEGRHFYCSGDDEIERAPVFWHNDAPPELVLEDDYSPAFDRRVNTAIREVAMGHSIEAVKRRHGRFVIEVAVARVAEFKRRRRL